MKLKPASFLTRGRSSLSSSPRVSASNFKLEFTLTARPRRDLYTSLTLLWLGAEVLLSRVRFVSRFPSYTARNRFSPPLFFYFTLCRGRSQRKFATEFFSIRCSKVDRIRGAASRVRYIWVSFRTFLRCNFAVFQRSHQRSECIHFYASMNLGVWALKLHVSET